MSIHHLLSLPRWLVAAIILVVALLGVTDQLERSAVARAAEVPCTFASVDYVYEYAPSLDDRAVTGAEIDGVAPECAGRVIQLTLTAKDGSPLAAASTRMVSPRTELELPATEALDPDGIDRFDVVLDDVVLDSVVVDS